MDEDLGGVGGRSLFQGIVSAFVRKAEENHVVPHPG